MAERPGIRRRSCRVLAAIAVAGLILLGVITARLFIWPDLQPLPPRVDVIVELGGLGDRDDAALGLARAHRGPVLIQSTVIEEAGTERCLPPVPGVRILCFHPDPDTTRGEAEYIGQLAAQHHWRSVALVTTPDQAWRARLRMTRCFGGDVYVSTTPLPVLAWFWQIPYQWVATAKALAFERSC